MAVLWWHVAEPSSWSLLIPVCQLGKRLAAPSVAADIATVVMMFRGVHALVMSPGDVPDGNNTLWSSHKFLEPNVTVLGTLQKSQKGFRQDGGRVSYFDLQLCKYTLLVSPGTQHRFLQVLQLQLQPARLQSTVASCQHRSAQVHMSFICNKTLLQEVTQDAVPQSSVESLDEDR